MIPRYQRYLFIGLIAASILMAAFLIHMREKAHDSYTSLGDATPISAPSSADAENIIFATANDEDVSITQTDHQIALPGEPTVRARALIEKLLAEYALPKSTHPLSGGAAVDDVFLVTLPITNPGSIDSTYSLKHPEPPTYSTGTPGSQLAIINLRSSFADAHPSGIAAETLTIRSIIGTLHANFPQIDQVKFLVDGQPRETLNGHVDLLRTYPAAEPSQQSTPATP